MKFARTKPNKCEVKYQKQTDHPQSNKSWYLKVNGFGGLSMQQIIEFMEKLIRISVFLGFLKYVKYDEINKYCVYNLNKVKNSYGLIPNSRMRRKLLKKTKKSEIVGLTPTN